ncbi:MAG TPA: ATP-binding protein, partial [Streptomyces sp.]
MIYGRERERARLMEALARARAGRSAAVVLRGAAGIGKTALLDAVADAVADTAVTDAAETEDSTRVLRVTGIEAETGLPFAALHALLRPVLDRIPDLPEAQQDALRSALGLRADAVPDRFLVGLAVLTLLAELAGSGPVVCLVDDAQWLDPASAETLVFTARRLDAEGIAMIFAAREGDRPFPAPGVPELTLSGLDDDAALALLAATVEDLAPQARGRILREAEGNPLALVEFARMLPPDQREGALAPLGLHTDTLPVTGRVEQAYRTRIRELPEATRRLLLIAAAEDGGDLALVLRAAAISTPAAAPTGTHALTDGAARTDAAALPATGPADLGPADLGPAEEAGLVHLSGASFVFRHPLVKAAAYRSATLAARVAAHRALARALEPEGPGENGGDGGDDV